MNTIQSVIDEVYNRMGEHIEMQKDKKGFVIKLLASLLVKERNMNEYYKKMHK